MNGIKRIVVIILGDPRKNCGSAVHFYQPEVQSLLNRGGRQCSMHHTSQEFQTGQALFSLYRYNAELIRALNIGHILSSLFSRKRCSGRISISTLTEQSKLAKPMWEQPASQREPLRERHPRAVTLTKFINSQADPLQGFFLRGDSAASPFHADLRRLGCSNRNTSTASRG